VIVHRFSPCFRIIDSRKLRFVILDVWLRGSSSFHDLFNSAVFIVDELREQLDVVVKPFKSNYEYYSDILASTITADGAICLILDVLGLISSKLSEYKMLPINEA